MSTDAAIGLPSEASCGSFRVLSSDEPFGAEIPLLSSSCHGDPTLMVALLRMIRQSNLLSAHLLDPFVSTQLIDNFGSALRRRRLGRTH